MTGKYRGPAHQRRNIKVIQKQSIFISTAFHNFCNYEYYLTFRRLVDEIKDELKVKTIPKSNEVYISEILGCIIFNDIHTLSSKGLDYFAKTLDNEDFDVLKKSMIIKNQLKN